MTPQRTRATAALAISTVLLLCLVLGPGGAAAERGSIPGLEGTETWLPVNDAIEEPEGACGIAVSPPTGNVYVSDYYRRAVEIFGSSGLPAGSIGLAGKNPSPSINLNAVCGLAIDAKGSLYANELHESVLSLPSEDVIDSHEPTGVAVDAEGNLYVDDRTYVAVYEAPVTPGEEPVEKIGVGSLGEGYGVAVDSEGKRVYVPDAADDEVKVYESAVELDPIEGPSGSGFNSLADAAVAVDGSSGEGRGHLLVADNLTPGSENPEVAVYEFGAAGNFLDSLARRVYDSPIGKPLCGPIFGEPSGMAVDPSTGDLYVTTGNGEKSNVFKYGPYEAGMTHSSPCIGSGASAAVASGAPPGPVSGPGSSVTPSSGAAASVVVRHGPVQVNFDGKLSPHSLPRRGVAPVGIAVAVKITATGSGAPPQLRRIAIEINRNGHFTSRGLPLCRLREIQPSTTSGALAACGRSLVGEGHFSANVKLPEQSPFPSEGKVLAFNGRINGKPAILAHIYGAQPAPTSTVLPFLIRGAHGAYGTTLEASLPQATGNWGFVTGLRMTLRRRFSYHGKARSFLSAGCPAPAGFPSAAFPLARTSFAFSGGLKLVSVLSRTCRAKG